MNEFRTEIFKAYEEGCSVKEIADKYSTYPNAIRRMLIKAGYKMRDKSEAQKRALKTGRAKHPTLGKQRSEAVKNQISGKIVEICKNEKERDRRRECGKRRWENMSENEKAVFLSKAGAGLKRASVEGSKLERFLLEKLGGLGYRIEYHKTDLLANVKMHIDLYVPELRVAIEVDGPAHFFPVWGEESLQRHKKADAEKTGLLVTHNVVIIRVKQYKPVLSRTSKQDILSKISAALAKVKQKRESGQAFNLEERLVEIEA